VGILQGEACEVTESTNPSLPIPSLSELEIP